MATTDFWKHLQIYDTDIDYNSKYYPGNGKVFNNIVNDLWLLISAAKF